MQITSLCLSFAVASVNRVGWQILLRHVFVLFCLMCNLPHCPHFVVPTPPSQFIIYDDSLLIIHLSYNTHCCRCVVPTNSLEFIAQMARFLCGVCFCNLELEFPQRILNKGSIKVVHLSYYPELDLCANVAVICPHAHIKYFLQTSLCLHGRTACCLNFNTHRIPCYLEAKHEFRWQRYGTFQADVICE